MSWMEQHWLGFDTETTGVDTEHDRLVTAATVLRDRDLPAITPLEAALTSVGRNDQVTTWLANPGATIPDTATNIHGITNEMAEKHGRPINEVLDEIASTLVNHWREGHPVIIFNANYDLSLMNNELGRHCLGTFDERLEGDPMFIIDPLVLDRSLDRYRKGKKTLAAMADAYGVDVPEDVHTAEVDVILTLNVLEAIGRKHSPIINLTVEQIHDFQIKAHREWAHNFQEFLRSRGRDTTIDPHWPM